jgi:hypothetical protein
MTGTHNLPNRVAQFFIRILLPTNDFLFPTLCPRPPRTAEGVGFLMRREKQNPTPPVRRWNWKQKDRPPSFKREKKKAGGLLLSSRIY